MHNPKWTTDPKRIVPDGCIFITVKGAGVGKLFPGIAAAIGRDVYAFKPKEEYSTKFIEFALRSSISEILHHASGDIPGLSKVHILQHVLAVPPLEEQERLVARIESFVRREQELRKLIREAEKEVSALMPALLAKAFRGEL